MDGGGFPVPASRRGQLVQVPDQDDVHPTEGHVGHVSGQAQVLVHALKHGGRNKAELVHHQHIHMFLGWPVVPPEVVVHRRSCHSFGWLLGARGWNAK